MQKGSIKMTFTIQSTTDDVKVVRKTITNIGNATPLNPTGIVSRDNPTITVEYNSAFLTANYMTIPEFGRKYFIKVSVDTAGRMIISGTVDPLTSFESGILAAVGTAIRSESNGINMVSDEQLPIDPNSVNQISVSLQNNLFNTSSVTPYVLTVIGG